MNDKILGADSEPRCGDGSLGGEPSKESVTDLGEVELKRMYWHSRRGMLELDLLLVPFAIDCLAGLDHDQLADYRQLLQQEDQDLWSWLALKEQPPAESLRRSIALILDHNAVSARGSSVGTAQVGVKGPEQA